MQIVIAESSMSESVIVAIIVAIAPTITSLVLLAKFVSVHKQLNSRLTEWKEETRAANVQAVIAAYEHGRKDEKVTTETKGIKP